MGRQYGAKRKIHAKTETARRERGGVWKSEIYIYFSKWYIRRLGGQMRYIQKEKRKGRHSDKIRSVG